MGWLLERAIDDLIRTEIEGRIKGEIDQFLTSFPSLSPAPLQRQPHSSHTERVTGRRITYGSAVPVGLVVGSKTPQ